MKIKLNHLYLIFCLLAGLWGCTKEPEITGPALEITLIKPKGKKDFSFVEVKRAYDEKESKIKQSIDLLLEGPNKYEKKKNISTEIPRGTKLLSFEETDAQIVINLSQQFESGGGSASMRTRVDQVIKTLQVNEAQKPVLLMIENKKLQGIGGEGLFIKNPVVNHNNVRVKS